MILEKDSSVLGYPGETSKALDADHHSVCKYDGPADPNYITVRNALTSLISKIVLKTRPSKPPVSNRKVSHDFKSLLAMTEVPDVDYIFFRDQWTSGTNEWILREESYLEWLEAKNGGPSLLWLYGGAAVGKSVLSSFIINSLVERGFCCQYFFIRFGDQRKRSLSFLLRSIAYQIAQYMPDFLYKVVELGDDAVNFETADARTIWERIYKSTLFKLERSQPIYWIIDGIDEADDPRAILRLLSDVSSSAVPIRILLVGRQPSEFEASFRKLPRALNPTTLGFDGHLEDLHFHVCQELNMSGSAEYKQHTVERIIHGAQNNFLVSSAIKLLLYLTADIIVGSPRRRKAECMSHASRCRGRFPTFTKWHGSFVRSHGIIDHPVCICARQDVSIGYFAVCLLLTASIDRSRAITGNAS